MSVRSMAIFLPFGVFFRVWRIVCASGVLDGNVMCNVFWVVNTTMMLSSSIFKSAKLPVASSHG